MKKFEICKRNPSEPQGYIQWVPWAEKMSKTHDQSKCEYCNLWHVWIKKPKDENKLHIKQMEKHIKESGIMSDINKVQERVNKKRGEE